MAVRWRCSSAALDARRTIAREPARNPDRRSRRCSAAVTCGRRDAATAGCRRLPPGAATRSRRVMAGTVTQRHSLGGEEADDPPRRADQHPASQGIADRKQGPAGAAAAQIIPAGDVVALRIVDRVGEVGVAVMTEMIVPIARIGQPQAQRHEADQIVQPGPARRVAVQHLVLKGHVPGGDPGARRQQQPPGQGPLHRGQHHPAAIDHDGQPHRRPLDTIRQCAHPGGSGNGGQAHDVRSSPRWRDGLSLV